MEEILDPARPICDPHHHLWDLGGTLHYPWLVDEPMIPFRYGDYSKIRRSYLPADYRRDSARQNVIATVHMEAEVKRNDPVAEPNRDARQFDAPRDISGIVSDRRLQRGAALFIRRARRARSVAAAGSQ